MAARSLRRRLTFTVISIFLISWVFSALLTALAANVVLRSEVDKMLTALLEVAVKVGQTLQRQELEALPPQFSERMVVVDPARDIKDGTRADPVAVRFDENFDLGALGTPALNVWVGGIQLLVGENTPPFASPDGLPSVALSEQTIQGRVWRVKYRHDQKDDVWYAAGLPDKGVSFDAAGLLLRMLQPLGLIIPLTVVALYMGIQRNLRPLRSLSRLIESRQQNSSLQAIPAQGIPDEMVPVVDSLNHLLERLSDTLENEQRFTANAAHELQTPLAAIMTEVQLCQRMLKGSDSLDMMNRIYARVQRASHSVRQLLVLARLDPQSGPGNDRVALSDVLETAVLEVAHLLEERSLRFTFDVSPELQLRGNREALLILFRNLIGNAFRYTPAGGAVSVSANNREVRIENDSEEILQPERLLDRFYRGENAGASESSGTGLGLSIAKRICELQQSALSVAYADGRFSAAVVFN